MKERLKEVLAIVNHKGGVGKTTTVQNLAAGLLRRNPKLRILCIDLDPQGSLSKLMRWGSEKDKHDDALTVADALRNGADNRLPVYCSPDGIYYVPASPALNNIEPDLQNQMISKLVLRDLFGNFISYADNPDKECYIENEFDYVLIDCAPALSELTYNALGVATGIIIPVELSALAVDGIGAMLDAYKAVKRKLNPSLDLRGLLIVRADERTKVARETTDFLRDHYEDIFKCRIRECVKVKESQFQYTDIFRWAPDCTAAKDYADLVEEMSFH